MKSKEGRNMNKFKILGILSIYMIFAGCSLILQTFNHIPSTKLYEIKFSTEVNPDYKFFYSDAIKNDYLRKLRTEYGLDVLTKNTENELQKVKIILDWTNKQWDHNGSNQPIKRDAVSILEEVKNGKNFRCVEYGIVNSAALNSIGLLSRTIGLRTRDVEKVKYSAGHVATEVFISDYKKWVFLDPQFNIVPMLENIPLNAVEFQKAIFTKNKKLKLVNMNGEIEEMKKEQYVKFIAKHLFYFDCSFDNRIGYDLVKNKIIGHYRLTLVPLNAKEPKVFQRKYPIHCAYTNSIADFYREPILDFVKGNNEKNK